MCQQICVILKQNRWKTEARQKEREIKEKVRKDLGQPASGHQTRDFPNIKQE
jgi:hypothetical protein